MTVNLYIDAGFMQILHISVFLSQLTLTLAMTKNVIISKIGNITMNRGLRQNNNLYMRYCIVLFQRRH